MSKYDFSLDMQSENSLSILIKRIRPDSQVLEFGPAHGRMSRYLKETLNCKVYAVEIDAEAAQEAQKHCEKIIVGSASEIEIWLDNFSNIQFDYICFADVLEHLTNPLQVLTASKDLLKENGSILLSIPNLAHSAVIIDLLNDKFEYRSVGLLDNTHIHLFTKKSLDNMVDQAGLYKVFETATYVKPAHSEFKNDYKDLPSEIGAYLKSRENSEAYQYIYQLSTTKKIQSSSQYKKQKTKNKIVYFLTLLNLFRIINPTWIFKNLNK